MPYVLQEKRPELDKIIQKMSNRPYNNSMDLIDTLSWLINECKVPCDGSLNYILFKYCKYHVKPSYNNYKAFNSVLEYLAYIKYEEAHNLLHDMIINMKPTSGINKKNIDNHLNISGELSECVTEIRRCILSKYEDIKESENGPVL